MSCSSWLGKMVAIAAVSVCVYAGTQRHILAADSDSATNTLTDAEKAAGWKLLFDGKTTDGWQGFKKSEIGKGWKVEDGTLKCADPRTAGDILTKDKFGPFELQLDYNISENGNSAR